MTRKIILIVFLVILCCNHMLAQEVGFFGQHVLTSGDTDLYIDYTTRTNSYEITHRYTYDILLGDGSYFTAINVKSSDFSTFSASINSLYTKYKEWLEVAKRNNVANVEKEIPVSIRPVELIFSAFTYPDVYSIKPIFEIINSNAFLTLELKCKMPNGTYFIDRWLIKDPDDLKGLLEVSKYVRGVRVNESNKKTATEDLFN